VQLNFSVRWPRILGIVTYARRSARSVIAGGGGKGVEPSV
jgi:hypothetical protein